MCSSLILTEESGWRSRRLHGDTRDRQKCRGRQKIKRGRGDRVTPPSSHTHTHTRQLNTSHKTLVSSHLSGDTSGSSGLSDTDSQQSLLTTMETDSSRTNSLCTEVKSAHVILLLSISVSVTYQDIHNDTKSVPSKNTEYFLLPACHCFSLCDCTHRLHNQRCSISCTVMLQHVKESSTEGQRLRMKN